MIRKLIALLMAALMALTVCASLAEAADPDAPIVETVPEGETAETAPQADTPDYYSEDVVPVFLFRHYPDGIGYGNCPVYSAPSGEAFHPGFTHVETDREIHVAGKDVSGWLLVRYTTGNHAYRVGYIPKNKIQGFKAENNLTFSYFTFEAAADIPVTDDPLGIGTPLGTIAQGEVFAILAQYTYHGDWWYVECKIEGKFARGFIPRTVELRPTDRTVVDIPDLSTYPAADPEGNALAGTVTVVGDEILVRADAGTDFQWVERGRSYDVLPFYTVKTGTNNHSWYRVCVNGTWGWIAASLLREN